MVFVTYWGVAILLAICGRHLVFLLKNCLFRPHFFDFVLIRFAEPNFFDSIFGADFYSGIAWGQQCALHCF